MSSAKELRAKLAAVNARVEDLKHIAIALDVFQPGADYYTDDRLYQYHCDHVRIGSAYPDYHVMYHEQFAYHQSMRYISRNEKIPDGYIQVTDFMSLEEACNLFDIIIIHWIVESELAITEYINHAFYGE